MLVVVTWCVVEPLPALHPHSEFESVFQVLSPPLALKTYGPCGASLQNDRARVLEAPRLSYTSIYYNSFSRQDVLSLWCEARVLHSARATQEAQQVNREPVFRLRINYDGRGWWDSLLFLKTSISGYPAASSRRASVAPQHLSTISKYSPRGININRIAFKKGIYKNRKLDIIFFSTWLLFLYFLAKWKIFLAMIHASILHTTHQIHCQYLFCAFLQVFILKHKVSWFPVLHSNNSFTFCLCHIFGKKTIKRVFFFNMHPHRSKSEQPLIDTHNMAFCRAPLTCD